MKTFNENIQKFTAIGALVLHSTTASVFSAGITQHLSAIGSDVIPASYISATNGQGTEFIDFDNDGFVLGANGQASIPSNHYQSQRVTLLNLDVRNFANPLWTHSAPLGAWHNGFSNTITTPYSFVFDVPVASFSFYANDVEQTGTITFTTTTGTESFNMANQGGAAVTRFLGFTSPTNTIRRVDVMNADYHIIDDVRFGYVPEPMTLSAIASGALLLRRGRRD